MRKAVALFALTGRAHARAATVSIWEKRNPSDGRMMAARNSNRRRFQFSLRALLGMVLVASLGMSWLAVKLQRARNQRGAVEALREVGCNLEYDYEYPWSVGFVSAHREPPGPQWSRDLLGVDLFSDVAHVDFNVPRGCSAPTDDDLQPLRRLTELRSLDLCLTWLTDEGLEHVEGLSKLEVLDLSFTQVTDAGLERLRGLTSLRELSLVGTAVTDVGLQTLRESSTLEWLDLLGTQVTSEGIAELRQALPNCDVRWP
jgi:hypothetical protein